MADWIRHTLRRNFFIKHVKKERYNEEQKWREHDEIV